jgi:very-short-patch-repair endonuclease
MYYERIRENSLQSKRILRMLYYNGNLIKYSQNLRGNMTDAERRLWSKLRLKQLNGYQFYRQRVIGNYIVDFCSPALKLVIEVDGSQHYSDDVASSDKIRDKYLQDCGFKVLRFNDYEVLTNTNGVVENILENMK